MRSTMTTETDTTEQTIRAQIQRFDYVLADPEWEWGAMVDAALDVREALQHLGHV